MANIMSFMWNRNVCANICCTLADLLQTLCMKGIKDSVPPVYHSFIASIILFFLFDMITSSVYDHWLLHHKTLVDLVVRAAAQELKDYCFDPHLPR